MHSTVTENTACPVAVAIGVHKLAFATWRAAHERLWRLTEAVDPDMDIYNLDEIRAKLTARYGDAAPVEIDKLSTAREVSRVAGDAEDAAWDSFEASPLMSSEQIDAWSAYVKEHAAAGEGGEAVYLWKAMDRLGALLSERLAA